MKKLISLLLFVFTIACYSQENTIPKTDTNSSASNERLRKNVTIGKWSTVSLSSGISIPSSNFSDNSYAENGTYFELSGAYYFSKFGIGLSLGQYTNPTDSNLGNLTNSLDFSTTNSTEYWKVTYYGFGPEFTTSFNKMKASFLLRTGIMAIKPITLKSSYNENVDITIPFYSLETNKTSNVSYFSTAFKIGYSITQNLNIFANIDRANSHFYFKHL